MTVISPSYYTLNPTAKTITFTTPYDTLTAEEFISIRNLSKQIEVYNSNDPRKHTSMLKPDERTQDFDIQVSGGVLTYVVTAGMVNTDKLQIIIGWIVLDGGTP